MALKQIKIREGVYEQLKDYMRDDESYSIAIQNLIDENQRLQARNDELREDNDRLMRIAMKTEDSIAFPNINHSTIFAIIEVLKSDYSDEDKINCLKIYLRPNLDENPHAVKSCIDSFIQEHNDYAPILDKVSSWIQEAYEI